MPGPATYSTDENVATRARRQLDEIAVSVQAMEIAQRTVVGKLVELWPTSGWLAAGVRSAKGWLRAHTGQSAQEAARLERIARLCALDSALCAAVVEGRFPLGWADPLSKVVTAERAGFLTGEVVSAFLRLADAGVSDEQFADAVRFWKDQADQELAPRRDQQHALVASQNLFGGGDVHMSLAPVAFETFMTAIDSMTQDPDPKGSPYRRTLAERRADAADDMATFTPTHNAGSDQGCGVTSEDEDELADETFDGMTDPDDPDLFDDLLDEDSGSAEDREAAALRNQIRRRVTHRRRRARRQVRPRSGARTNIHIDLRTAARDRNIDELDDLVMRGEHWNLARSAAEQLLCDTTLVTTIFDGQRIIDANADAERFSFRQRLAIAARDRQCVFPGCTQEPRRCDTHHIHERNDGGPTVVSNGCLLCRFHHRLLHQYDWRLHQDPDGVWIAVDPHGHQWPERRPTDPAAA